MRRFRKRAPMNHLPADRRFWANCWRMPTLPGNEDMPICQDTGLAIVFVDVGQGCAPRRRSAGEAIHAGVAKGYVEYYLRKSAVAEPLFDRTNTKNNTPAVIHTRIVPATK